MTSNELGGRVQADGRAPRQGLTQVRAGKGVVNKERHTGLVDQFGDRLNVQHIQRGVAHGLGIHSLGLRCDGTSEVLGVCAVDKGGFYAQFFEVHTQLGVGAAIKRASCHDVVASLADVEQGNHLRSHAAACGHSGSATFECCNTFFQHRYRGIGQAGVDVTKGLQVKQAGCVFWTVKHI